MRWHTLHESSVECCEMRCRLVVLGSGTGTTITTSLGGEGRSWHNILRRTNRPRRTGEVTCPCALAERKLACVNTPFLWGGSRTFFQPSAGDTPPTPYNAASGASTIDSLEVRISWRPPPCSHTTSST